MGQTAIRQAVFDGDLDMDQVLASGLITGAQELADFLLRNITQAIENNTYASDEQAQELLSRQEELRDSLNQEEYEELMESLSASVNEQIANQQNEVMRSQFEDLQQVLQPIYESAYATRVFLLRLLAKAL